MIVELLPFLTRLLHVLADVWNRLWPEAPWCLGALAAMFPLLRLNHVELEIGMLATQLRFGLDARSVERVIRRRLNFLRAQLDNFTYEGADDGSWIDNWWALEDEITDEIAALGHLLDGSGEDAFVLSAAREE